MDYKEVLKNYGNDVDGTLNRFLENENLYKKFIRIIAKEKKIAEYDVFVDEYDSNYELKIVPLE